MTLGRGILDKMKILVVVAHPDDELLGVGGTLCKHIHNKDEVYVCIATKAIQPMWSNDYIQKKIKEQAIVDSRLGIKERYNLDLPTTQLNILPHGEINTQIMKVVNIVNPDIIYTHFEHDMNYDHTIIFRACMVATRPPKRIRLLCFETPSETEFNNKPFIPNYWVDISPFINKKIEAFKVYQSEVKEYPHPRSPEGIKILAQKRGMDICTKYAEAFTIIKDYWM